MKNFKLSQLVFLIQELEVNCGYDLESNSYTRDVNMKKALKVNFIEFNLFKINF